LQARPLLRERNYPDLIDERIINSYDVHQLFWMVRIAEKCLSREPQRRLNMVKVGYIFGSFVLEYSSLYFKGEGFKIMESS